MLWVLENLRWPGVLALAAVVGWRTGGVGAAVAATCYVDHSPPPTVKEVRPGIIAVRGEGRPSKRLRREFERLRRAAD